MDEKRLAEWSNIGGVNPKERRQRLIEFMKESDKAQTEATKPILDILTPEQRAKFEKLQGRKVEVTRSYEVLMPEDAGF